MFEDAPIELAERAIIGAVLLSGGDVLDDLTLRPSDFRDPSLAAVYGLAMRMHANGEAIDTVTMFNAVRISTDAALARFDAAELHSMAGETPSVASATAYERIVARAAVGRRLGVASQKMATAAKSDMDAEEILEVSRRAVEEAAGETRAYAHPIADDLDAALEEFLDPPPKVPTPWPELDDAIGGFMPGRLYIVGARPAVGKSVVALQCGITLAKKGPVAYSSLEMARNEIIGRALSMGARVAGRRLAVGNLSPDEWERVRDATERLRKLPLHVDDRSDVTVTQIRQHARAVARNGQLGGIVLDYLQLMRGERGDKRPRHEVVAEYSRQLKILAREMDAPVIALSQLNRASTMRADGKPMLQDLRESGAVEQDADVVILLHRNLTEPDKSRTLHMDIAKNRQGPTCGFNLDYVGDFTEAQSRRRN